MRTFVVWLLLSFEVWRCPVSFVSILYRVCAVVYQARRALRTILNSRVEDPAC